ncbi:hypothetical protein [Brachybacterium sacelli]|uniref:Uncharacterized protein n=2 Tax=Brachybacterium sacelli TaxID=173364 RepID=A0ABS4X5M6_9MICO|nr:hypothetical protein [Brachybacterium sacelli]MBP2383766.1 hypothetical protein [Brachybacterium sacelli]
MADRAPRRTPSLTVPRLPYDWMSSSLDQIHEQEFPTDQEGQIYDRYLHETGYEGYLVDPRSGGLLSYEEADLGALSSSVSVLATTADSITFDLTYHDWTTTDQPLEYRTYSIKNCLLLPQELAHFMQQVRSQCDARYTVPLPGSGYTLLGYGHQD